MKTTTTSVLTLLTAIAITVAGSISAQAQTGNWSKAEVSTTGSWSIEGNTITLTGLKTKSAPDLKLILSPHEVGSLQSSNAISGAVIVSPLTSHEGTQTYTIPAGVDLSQFKSIGIHCQKYTKLFAKSAL